MTETENTLSQLIEQAACCFNMLTPADASDAQALDALLGQIGDLARGMCPGPSDLRQKLEGTTAEAMSTLQQILHQQVQDTATALDTVSKAICALQSLVAQMTSTPPQAAPLASPKAMTISPEDAPLVLDFVAEASEHVETAESAMLELENHPGDNELINKIFRAFHTIKGMAGFLNLAEIQSLAHSAENLLDLARKSQLVLTGDNSDVVFKAIDVLKKMVSGLKQALESNQAAVPCDSLPRLLEELQAAAQGRAPSSPKAVANAQQTDRKLDAILEDPPDARKTVASATHAVEEKIKVSVTRLDNLVNLAGELVIAQLMVAEEIRTSRSFEHELARKVTHQGKIVRELQELSMSMRMVPVQGVFQKMTRLARDLSHKAAKSVDFVTLGEETELDRTVVDQISDPLVHMVRNAVDHGIESPEDRIAAGKSPTGRVELRAFHQAGNIIIELQDDGKGLDKDRILKKAVEQHLVEPGQELPDEEIFKLIFHPGLSTAQTVTAVSGRGVGMDVVKKNIEALRGRIDISSTRGKGTTFTIRLPLTLAVIDGQVVRVGDARYIIPINSIVRSLRPSREQISSVQGRGEMVLERGQLMPLIRLYRLFGVQPSTEDPTQALIVIVEGNGRNCCLLVDDLLAQQQVVIKNLGETLGQTRGTSGGAIMGDGLVTLILDVPGLVQLAQERYTLRESRP
ncbi:MAG: chemotaxis protein CheA [Sedimentisphaerales bacterium]|nr:chemotaxis protein CheA [Sedimentisphaerales bacterium]